jgi:hypothetical protein
MNIIYLCPKEEDSRRKVNRIIEIMIAAEKYEVFHKVNEFENYARSSLLHQHVIILQAGNMKSLQKIAALKELLFGHRVILILPDREQETIALGHSLRPRFITYQDSDFLEMASVLYKMLQREKTMARPLQNPY